MKASVRERGRTPRHADDYSHAAAAERMEFVRAAAGVRITIRFRHPDGPGTKVTLSA
jgi:hypothetical protein